MVDRRKLSLFLATTLLLLHAMLLAFGAFRNSPARDEVAHLTAGLSHLELQRFDLYRVNPPLVRTIAAIPLWLSAAERDWSRYLGGNFDRPEFRVGADFIHENGERAFAYFTYGRLMCVPFSLLGGWICYRWSNELFGEPAGLIAIALWCFLPEIIANGQLLTPDVAATSLGLLFWYSLWRWQRQPSWRGAVVAGAALGVSLLSKTTWLAAYPLIVILTLFWSHRSDTNVLWSKRWTQLGVMVFLSVYLINLGYLFEGTGTRLGEFPFISTTLSGEEARVAGNRFSNTWLGQLPVPLPRNFVLGIDVQKYEFDEREYNSYLRGAWQQHGWWYYYLYGLGVKTPVGCLALLGIAIYVVPYRWKKLGTWAYADLLALLLPALGILVLVSSQTGFNHHLRYVLPATPYLLIFASGGYVALRSDRAKTLALLLVCISCISSLFCFPHHQSYFNELVGGPLHGSEHLVNSNVDWGQDMHRIRDWLREHPEGKPLHLIAHCNYDIRVIASGNDWVFPKEVKDIDKTEGWFAVSVNDLRDVHGRYSALLGMEPVDFVGYSTRIFRIPASDSPESQILGETNLPSSHTFTSKSDLRKKVAWTTPIQ